MAEEVNEELPRFCTLTTPCPVVPASSLALKGSDAPLNVRSMKGGAEVTKPAVARLLAALVSLTPVGKISTKSV